MGLAALNHGINNESILCDVVRADMVRTIEKAEIFDFGIAKEILFDGVVIRVLGQELSNRIKVAPAINHQSCSYMKHGADACSSRNARP